MEDSTRDLVIQKLCALLSEENALSRCYAAKALGSMGAIEAVPSLIKSLRKDPDPDLRMEAAAALGALASPESVEPLIDSLHYDPDGEVRIQACIALGKIRAPQALETLIEILTIDETIGIEDWSAGDDMEYNASWEIQHRALEALEEIGDERAVSAVIHLLAIDEYIDLQEQGFRVLATLGGVQTCNFLLEQLREGHRLTRRRAAKALIQMMQEPAVVQALTKALLDKDPDVRIAVAYTLAASADPAVTDSLIALLKDPSAEVRRDTAALVAKFADPEVTKPLILLLKDPQQSVQLQAIRSLGERRAEMAVEHLLRLLEQSLVDDAFGSEIVQALGKIGNVKALSPLCQLLQDKQRGTETRFQAVLALGNILRDIEPQIKAGTPDQPDAVAILKEAVHDTDEKVCFGALHSLARIGGPRVSDFLYKALRGKSSAREEERVPETGLLEEKTAESEQSLQIESYTEERPSIQEPILHTSTLAAIEAQYRTEMQQTQAAVVPLDSSRQEHQRMVRRFAAKVLREYKDPAVVEILMQAAVDTDTALQREAILSLGFLGDRKALPVLLQGLASGTREVRLAALDALELLKTIEAVESLSTIVNEETDSFVVQRAIEVLATLGERRAAKGITQRLTDDQRPVRQAALKALAALGERETIPLIRPLIFARGGELRHEAITTLKALGDTDVPHLLLETLNTPEAEEQHWIALEALAEFYKMH